MELEPIFDLNIYQINDENKFSKLIMRMTNRIILNTIKYVTNHHFLYRQINYVSTKKIETRAYVYYGKLKLKKNTEYKKTNFDQFDLLCRDFKVNEKDFELKFTFFKMIEKIQDKYSIDNHIDGCLISLLIFNLSLKFHGYKYGNFKGLVRYFRHYFSHIFIIPGDLKKLEIIVLQLVDYNLL